MKAFRYCKNDEYYKLGLVLYYKTFYGSNCCQNMISQSVCHSQSLPHQSNIFWQAVAYQNGAPYRNPLQWQAPGLAHKYQTRTEVNGSGEHSSLVRYGNIYCHKRFTRKGLRIQTLCCSIRLQCPRGQGMNSYY